MQMKANAEGDVRTWVEVDADALAHNYGLFRNLIAPGCKIAAVAKSNAYGHDIYQYAAAVEKLGADWIAVDSIVEAVSLRKSGIRAPVLVLGYTLPSRYGDAVIQDASITISGMDALVELARFDCGGKKIKAHFKIDTGMHRQGFLTEELPAALALFKTIEDHVVLEGIYTHFAGAKRPGVLDGTNGQVTAFTEATRLVERAGYRPLRHAAATAGTIAFPEAHFDMVRIGIGLYGLWPSPELRMTHEGAFPLRPILSWKTIIGELKSLPKGSGVGYNHAEILSRDSVLAVCPVGYWHGYPRALSGVGTVSVLGKSTRVVGRVSMDMLSVNVTDIPNVAVGDEVCLIGRQVPADLLAFNAETINYEIVTRINPLIRRIYSTR